jgi:hypothetical protein
VSRAKVRAHCKEKNGKLCRTCKSENLKVVQYLGAAQILACKLAYIKLCLYAHIHGMNMPFTVDEILQHGGCM